MCHSATGGAEAADKECFIVEAGHTGHQDASLCSNCATYSSAVQPNRTVLYLTLFYPKDPLRRPQTENAAMKAELVALRRETATVGRAVGVPVSPVSSDLAALNGPQVITPSRAWLLFSWQACLRRCGLRTWPSGQGGPCGSQPRLPHARRTQRAPGTPSEEVPSACLPQGFTYSAKSTWRTGEPPQWAPDNAILPAGLLPLGGHALLVLRHVPARALALYKNS